MWPLRFRAANGAYLTCVVRTMFGENVADRGRGLGPWTVQASFRADDGGIRDLGEERAAEREAEGSNST